MDRLKKLNIDENNTFYRRIKIIDIANCARKITYLLRDYYHIVVSQRDANNNENAKKNLTTPTYLSVGLSLLLFIQHCR